VSDQVWAVHTRRAGPDETPGAVEIIWASEEAAHRYARSRSQDWSIDSASVTRYTIGELGSRTPVEWWRNGERANGSGNPPGRQYYPTDGPVASGP
jgi:hypothetical protein